MEETIETPKKKPSKVWYLLPIFLTWIGGIIGYFLMKDRDKEFAKRLLIVGVILTVVYIIIMVVIGTTFLFGIFSI